MVKTTKKLLNFLQSLNKCVQKKTEKEYLFIRRYILFWGKMKTAKGPARRFAVAWLRIFLFFACDSRQIACIVEYWDVL